MSTGMNQPNIDSSVSDTVTWLANEIFKAFPEAVTGVTFYFLDCGCVYYRRKFLDGDLDHKIGIYRNGANGPCETCMCMDGNWKARVVDERVIYNSKFQIG